MKKYLLVLFCFAAFLQTHAQLVDVINEVHFSSGGTGDIPAGYTTYRIYARLKDPTDRISAVFGSNDPSPTHHLHIHSGNAANAIYNSSFAGTLGTDNNCAFWGFFPQMAYDSYVTFRAVDTPTDPCPQCAPTGTIFQISNPAGVIPGTFATSPLGPDLTMVDGSWFIPNDGSCYGFPTGADNRILIAQVTVPTGTLAYWLNISLFDEAVGANQLIYVHTQQDDPEFVGTIPEIDGNCLGLVYPYPVECGGLCNDPTACNFDPQAVLNWNCVYPGCNNPDACNYDPDAGCDDGSCGPFGAGCTDNIACNFDPEATCDNGLCIYPAIADAGADIDVCYYDNTAQLNASDQFSGIWQIVSGSATIWQPANSNSILANIGFGLNVLSWTVNDPCSGPITDLVNVYKWQEDEEGSPCLNYGCTDASACNYDPDATIDSGDCGYFGCTSILACNYDIYAACDDGTCTYDAIKGHVFNDANANGIWTENFFDEPGMFNRQVHLDPLGMVTYTDNNGYFEFLNIPDGEYTVWLEEDNVWEATTAASVNFTMPGCDSFNFGLAPSDQTAFWISGPCCIWMMDIHCTNGLNPGLWVNNTGPVALNGTFTISCDEVLTATVLAGIATPPTSIEPGLISWDVNNQLPGQNKLYQCHINGPGVEYIGDVFPLDMTLTLWDENEEVFYENTWVLEPTVVCAYDPNDKYAEPMGYTEENHFILPEQRIEYRIRFQNTGNFVAEDIVIADTLDLSVLDLDTFEPLFASANYMACLHPDGIVEFIFNDIMLPDSTTDEPGSQGFVVFQIDPIENIAPGTVINNSAAIIFDGNPPVITNTMWHTIYHCDGVAGISSSGNPVCFGQAVTLASTEPYMETMQWMEGDILVNESGEFIPAIASDGTYTFSLHTTNPICEEDGEIEIVVHPVPEVSAGEDVAVCDGETVLLDATGAAEIVWSNGTPDNSDYAPAQNETLIATAINEFGCSDSDELDITVNPLPGIELTQSGAVFTAPDGSSWQWYNEEGLIPGATNQNYTAEEDGTYWCVVSNEFDCTSVTEQITFIGVAEHDGEGILLFPNPMRESSLLVLSPVYQDASVNIIDADGREVKNLGRTISGLINIERSSLAPGTYFITLKRNGQLLKHIRLILQ